MGEALIWYRRRGGVDPELLKPTTITNNGNYTAPITGTYRVYTVGGGGGGGGGCRNAWNVSQVFYGSAGTRGTLNVVNVTLNQGDNVVCTIGAGGTGGTNNTTRTSYSNGTYNSRGTNGTAGGSTSFGSYGLGAGGTSGKYSWSRTYWRNTSSWNNVFKCQWFNNMRISGTGYIDARTYDHNNRYKEIYVNNLPHPDNDYIIKWNYFFNGSNYSITSDQGNPMTFSNDIFKLNVDSLYTYDSRIVSDYGEFYYFTIVSPSKVTSAYKHKMKLPSRWTMWMSGNGGNEIYGNNNFEVSTLNAANFSVVRKVNEQVWNNKIMNTTTRCYTSIQVGSWWYLNNNIVTTSGSRIYRGDGGNSGRSGNAGYILVIPPQS